MLPLLLLLLTAGCQGTAVHEVAISVRSVRSVTYLGTQVSVFQHVNMPLRYFFQPLSLFDVSSVRLEKDAELNVTRLHLDVYLWTKEFMELVRSHFPSAESVELMPLTQIRVAWSQQAASWLGHGFNESLHLLDSWRDADKPQQRSTFTVVCDNEAACLRLQRRLNGSRELAESVFDLQYRVPFASRREVSLTVRSRHLVLSPTFKQLQSFADSRARLARRILVTGEMVDELVEETLATAVAELQTELRQLVDSIDAESQEEARRQLQLLLREKSVQSPTLQQWRDEVAWPTSRRYLRPDRLADTLNRLLAPAGRPLRVRLSNSSAAVAAAVSSSFPDDAAVVVAKFVRLHSPRRLHEQPPLIDVRDVVQLADSVGSSVAWDAESSKFKAAGAILFSIDVKKLVESGILLLRSATVELRASQHADRLQQLRRSADADFGAPADCAAQLDIAQQQLQRLAQNVSQLAAAVAGNGQRLESWIQVLAPAAPVGDVQRRGGELRILRQRVSELAAAVANASGRWQEKVADSFCVLADRADPPGLVCRSLGFFIPYKSLRYSPWFHRQVRVQRNTIGQNLFTRVDDKFFKFQLRICCK